MKQRKINQIHAGAIVSYITIFFNIISGFLYTPWLINQLGQSDYALFTLVNSVMAYFVLDFGMGAAITRFITRYRVNGEYEKINNLLGVTTKLYLTIDGIILMAMIIFYALIDKIYVNLSSSEILKLENLFIIAGTVALLSFPLLPINGIYTAYEKFYEQKMFDLLAKVITVILVVVALLAGGGLYFVVLFNTSISFFVNLIKYFHISKTQNININLKYKDKELKKNIFSFSAWVMVAGIADRFFFTFIPSLLAMISNSKEIAIFGVAVSIEGYTALFTSVFVNLFLPRVTSMVVKNESTEKITDLMIKVGRIQLVIISTIVTVMVAMGKEFIICWVGKEYEDSYIVLVLILISTLIRFCQSIGYEMLYATNNIKYKAMVYVLGSLISIVTTLILGGRFGAIGAGIGICLSLVVSHIIIMNIVFYKKLKLNIPRYFKECQVKMIIPMLISGVIGYFLMVIYPVDNLLYFFVKAGIWAIFHVAILWFGFFNKYEKDLFLGYVKKFIKIK